MYSRLFCTKYLKYIYPALELANLKSHSCLPIVRQRLSEPFSITGVGLAGLLYVRSGSDEVKTKICLFSYAVTRALHWKLSQA